MKELIQLYKQYKSFFNKAEEIHDHNAALGKENVLDTLLPLAYDRIKHQPTRPKYLDDKSMMLIGGFLSHHFPHLKPYFISQELRDDQAYLQGIYKRMNED